MALDTHIRMRCTSFVSVLLAVALTASLQGVARAQPADTAPAAGTDAAATEGAPQQPARIIALFAGQSRLVDLPWPATRVSVVDPAIADVDVTSPSRITLQGKSVGTTEVLVWGEQDRTWQARIEVEADVTKLQAQLNKLFPGSAVKVTQLGDVLAVSGTLEKAEQVRHLRRFLELSDVRYLDATSVAGVQQVQLQVKVAEVSRSALKTLGVNAFYGGSQWFGGLQIGSSSGPLTPMPVGLPSGSGVAGNLPFQMGTGGMSVPASATLFAGFPGSDLMVFIQALAENQYLRVLAEPTLVAMSGEEAQFLVGGEVPIPVTEFGDGSTSISIEYKEFGVRLRFLPTVLGNGVISLRVMPEVSQLSDVGAIVVEGLRIPSLLTRRVETTLELQSGQTFAIAGLISRTDNARNSRVPGLGDLPVLGSMFRSVRYETQETELMVLVTANLVEPLSAAGDVPVPGLTHEEPNPWEFYLEGRLEAHPPSLSEDHRQRLDEMGLDELRGPGAWATYDEQPSALAGQPEEISRPKSSP
jgi:pilus assembly protein CpaC